MKIENDLEKEELSSKKSSCASVNENDDVE